MRLDKKEEDPSKIEKKKKVSAYIGSVIFYKHLILAVVLILILASTICAISFHASLSKSEDTRQKLQAEVTRLHKEVTTTSRKLKESETLLAEQAEKLSSMGGGLDELPPEAIYYQSLYPDFYAPQPYQASERTPGTVYLTFDGGPSSNTARILEILEEEDVKATFFVTGQSDEAGYQLMRDIAEQGHTLGMHSYSQDYAKVYGSVESFLDDMYQIFSQIREATGKTPTVFRFPGGSINSYNAGIYQELVAEMLRRGFVPCDWNVSAEDAAGASPSVDQIVRNVMGSMDRIERGFVLLHDGDSQTTTVDALKTLIGELRGLGFDFACMTPETKPVLFVYKD